MVRFYQIEIAKPVVPRYDGDPLGRRNSIKILNLGKTRMEMRGDQDESTRNKTSKMERNQGIEETWHMQTSYWSLSFSGSSCSCLWMLCVFLQVSAMAGSPCNICVCGCVHVCPLGSSLARDCLQTESCHLASSKVHWLQLPSKQVILF